MDKQNKDIKIIIIGYGNVGKNLISIIKKQHNSILKIHSIDLKIIAICEIKGCVINSEGIDLQEVLNLKEISQSQNWITGKNNKEILSELKADFMVECAWTNNITGEPALSHVINALDNKINVVSSNKGPFYLKYTELMNLAKKNNVHIGIESTVGSAIPCLTAKETLSGTKIKSVRAILNGTSNYIISRMTSENLTFDLALKEAQDLGYAEADPTLDIEGYDAAGKMVIIANELLGWNKTIEDVKIQGITGITSHAIDLAKMNNYLIKHIGVAKDNQLSVGLQLVPKNSSLAVNGSLNVAELETEFGGPITFVGRGAGGSEAASGILSDIIRISYRL